MPMSYQLDQRLILNVTKIGDAFASLAATAEKAVNAYALDVAKKPDLSKKNYTIVVNVDAKNEVERENGTSYSEPRLEKVVSAIENLDRPQDV